MKLKKVQAYDNRAYTFINIIKITKLSSLNCYDNYNIIYTKSQVYFDIFFK